MLVNRTPAIGWTMILLLVVSLNVPGANAFFRHLCHGEVGIGRIDPIVTPGEASAHCHGIHGAQNMGFDVDYNYLLASNCTSCSVRQDKSAYWSPYLYFQHANGTYELVPKAGGLTVYYFTERPADQPDGPIVAFPPGFRMVAGNNMKRAFYNGTKNQVKPPYKKTWTQHDIEQQAMSEVGIGFNCLNYHAQNENALARYSLPDKSFIDTCADGVRAEIMFPSCWNGVDIDSQNHADHVSYPTSLRNGPCPAGFEKRFPALFFETIYWTPRFKSMDGQFIFANGDPTGFGYHADFINGWEDGVLQAAIDNIECTNEWSTGEQTDCPVLQIKPDDEVVNCKMDIPEVLQSEQVNFVAEFPGSPGIYPGPEFAPLPGKPDQPPMSSSIEPTIIGSGTAILPTSSVPPYPANSTTVASPVPTSPVATISSVNSNKPVDWTYYHVEGNKTTEVLVYEQVVVTTVTVTPALSAEPTATAPMVNNTSSAALAGPVKRHRHAHGRVHI